jgi:hypothetical protein
VTTLDEQLITLILGGFTAVNADDVTACGTITLDSEHRPNGKQNGIGSFFQRKRKEGILTPTGNYVQSRSIKRKGGTIQIWQVTPYGAVWARGKRPKSKRPPPRLQ